MSSAVPSGNEGCSCIDASTTLESLSDRHCQLPAADDSENNGILLSLSGESCASFTYGSNACLQHDLLHDPSCQKTSGAPSYCSQPWCFVDMESCKRDSSEEIFASSYFPETDLLYYSYSTCGSSADAWQAFEQNSTASALASTGVMGGVNLTSAIPGYMLPMLYKRDIDGNIVYPQGDEFYDNSVPFEGVYLDYITKLIKISGGDINNISHTFTSRHSSQKHRSATGAVQDISNGLADMAIGPYWVTGERLKMTGFTVPFVYDQTVLVIPKPGSQDSLLYEIQKVLQPFTWEFWLLLIGTIIVTALLAVWFSEYEKIAKQLCGRGTRRANNKLKKTIWFRLFIDAIIQKGIFFFSAGVEQDSGASLPHKTLMFGFSFFILITVSAYVANLAAFLTQSGMSSYVGTMKDVVEQGIPICAHIALQQELVFKWPEANWRFSYDDNNFHGVLDKYARNECKVLAIGREDTTMDIGFMDRMCDMGLVYTDSLIIDNAMAFPIKPEFASGFSYWMYMADKYNDISIATTKEEYKLKFDLQPKCGEVDFSAEAQQESNDYTQITPKNMFFPILFFLICALIAIILQIIHDRSSKWDGRGSKIGNKSMMGRLSTMNLYTNESKGNRKVDKDDGMDSKEDNFDENDKSTGPNLQNLPFRPTPKPSIPQDEENANRSVTFNLDNSDHEENANRTATFNIGNSDHEEFFDCTDLSEIELSQKVEKSIDDILRCFEEMKRLKKEQ